MWGEHDRILEENALQFVCQFVLKSYVKKEKKSYSNKSKWKIKTNSNEQANKFFNTIKTWTVKGKWISNSMKKKKISMLWWINKLICYTEFVVAMNKHWIV